MFKKIRTFFVSGLVLLAPLYLTVLVLGYLVRLTDAFVVNPVFRLLPVEVDAESKVFLTKVLIILSVVVFVTALGFAAEKFIFRKLLESGESFLKSIPVFNKVYCSFRDIAKAMFGGDKLGIFKRVVFVEYPCVGVYTMGFVTNENFHVLTDKLGDEILTVFVPSPPNPTTGYAISVARKKVIDTDLTVEQGIKLCVSCGAAAPAKK